MAYGRYGRYKSKKTRAGRNKKHILVKKNAKAQQKQLMSLQKQVNVIKRDLGDSQQHVQYKYTLSETGMEHNWTVIQLTRPDQWTPVFQSTSETNNSNKFRIRKLHLETLMTIYDTEAPLPPQIVTFFLVSLRKEAAAQTIEDLGGIELPNINSDGVNSYFSRTDFGGGTYQGLVRLNPAAFKIHRVKRFEIQNILNWTPGPDDQLVNTPMGVRKRMTLNVTRGNLLKSTNTKIWKNMEQEDCAHTDLFYVMVHISGADNVTPNPPLAMAHNATFTGLQTN